MDLLELNDWVVIGGAATSCHTPALWVFDTLGQFKETIYLRGVTDEEPFYDYGKITSSTYDSINMSIYAIGNVAIADDVGSRMAFVGVFDHNLTLANFYVHAHLPNNS
jgi:hypothetical protein